MLCFSSHHSGLSAGTPHSQLLQHTPEDVNPFEQHIVNMMLNTLSLPVGRMEKISGSFPRVVSGQSLDVGGECYSNVKKLTEGGFATIYVGDHNGTTDTLKVGCWGACQCCMSECIEYLTFSFLIRFKVLRWSGSWLW